MPDENSQFAKEEVSAAFDRMSSYYAGERGQSPWFQAQLKIVLEMLDSEQGLLLDVGCAAGAEFEPLLARGFQIVGLDYAPKMLGLAQQRFGASHGLHLCRADAESLPFPGARPPSRLASDGIVVSPGRSRHCSAGMVSIQNTALTQGSSCFLLGISGRPRSSAFSR